MAVEFGFDSIDDGKELYGLDRFLRETVSGTTCLVSQEPIAQLRISRRGADLMGRALPGPILSWSQSFVLVWYCPCFSKPGLVSREPKCDSCSFFFFGEGRASWEVALAILPPEMAGG